MTLIRLTKFNDIASFIRFDQKNFTEGEGQSNRNQNAEDSSNYHHAMLEKKQIQIARMHVSVKTV